MQCTDVDNFLGVLALREWGIMQLVDHAIITKLTLSHLLGLVVSCMVQRTA